MMLMEKVLKAAEPYLAGRSVKDLVIGVSLIGVELDNGAVGVSYLLREDLPAGCSAFPYAQEQIIGRPAAEIAAWALNGEEVMQRGVASAVLAAAADAQDIPDDNVSGAPFGLEIRPGDTVGMVGLIAPVARQIMELTPNLLIFDAHIPSAPGLPPVQSMELQPELLGKCDLVILSGTTTINGSIDALTQMCVKTREIVMVGQSTPMFAAGWQGSRVTRLAGATWKNECKEDIFKQISLACGTTRLAPYMYKKRMDV